jgi:hypothetical protein
MTDSAAGPQSTLVIRLRDLQAVLLVTVWAWAMARLHGQVMPGGVLAGLALGLIVCRLAARAARARRGGGRGALLLAAAVLAVPLLWLALWQVPGLVLGKSLRLAIIAAGHVLWFDWLRHNAWPVRGGLTREVSLAILIAWGTLTPAHALDFRYPIAGALMQFGILIGMFALWILSLKPGGGAGNRLLRGAAFGLMTGPAVWMLLLRLEPPMDPQARALAWVALVLAVVLVLTARLRWPGWTTLAVLGGALAVGAGR